MIGVRVREHDGVDPVDAEPFEVGDDRARTGVAVIIGHARVHEQRAAVGEGDEGGVALPHVEEQHVELGGRGEQADPHGRRAAGHREPRRPNACAGPVRERERYQQPDPRQEPERLAHEAIHRESAQPLRAVAADEHEHLREELGGDAEDAGQPRRPAVEGHREERAAEREHRGRDRGEVQQEPRERHLPEVEEHHGRRAERRRERRRRHPDEPAPGGPRRPPLGHRVRQHRIQQDERADGRERELEAHVGQRGGPEREQPEPGEPQRVQRVDGPVQEVGGEREPAHDERADGGDGRAAERDVRRQQDERRRRAQQLRRLPAEAEPSE